MLAFLTLWSFVPGTWIAGSKYGYSRTSESDYEPGMTRWFAVVSMITVTKYVFQNVYSVGAENQGFDH